MRQSAAAVRSTTWCALLGYVVVASGLPLPFASLPVDRGGAGIDPAAALLLAAKDRSRPFPCMDKPCGCASAEQCFTSCCCHSPAERLAWARARGCEAVVRAALARAPTPRPKPRPDEAASCCAAKAACCPQQADCCATTAERSEQPAPAATACRGRSVSLRAMLACGGIVAQWFAAGSALPPPRPAPPLSPPRPQRVGVADIRGDALRPAPDVPPPRPA